MDNKANVGGHAPYREYLRDIDVYRRSFTESFEQWAVSEPARLYALVEAITQGDVTYSFAVLRMWGIFATTEGAPSLSCDTVRLSELLSRDDEDRLERSARTFRMLSSVRPRAEYMGAILEGERKRSEEFTLEICPFGTGVFRSGNGGEL